MLLARHAQALSAPSPQYVGRTVRPTVHLWDLVTVTAAVTLGLAWGDALWSAGAADDVRDLVLYVPALWMALRFHGANPQPGQGLGGYSSSECRATANAAMTGVVFMLALNALFGQDSRPLGVGQAALVGVLLFGLVPLGRSLSRRLSVTPAQPLRVLIVGAGAMADRLQARLLASGSATVIGLVDDDPPIGHQVLGSLADLSTLCDQYRPDHVLVAFSRTASHETLDSLRRVARDIPLSVVPRFFELVTPHARITELHGIPLLDVAPPAPSTLARSAKRLTDILGALIALVITLPTALVVALAIKLTSPGPVFFRQTRIGRNGRPFSILKFRTMVADAEAQKAAVVEYNEFDGPLFKMRDDPRVTRIGHFLRRTSIDELPQILNVLLGEMSLVGPRPFLVEEAERIKGYAARRLDVLPGMTGLWQVCGRSELSYEDLRHLDTVYVAYWSFSWDLKIMLKTLPAVMKRSGAY